MNKGAKYFEEIAAIRRRDEELRAFYVQSTVLGPILEELTALRETIAQLSDPVTRIAEAAEKMVAPLAAPSVPPVEPMESPEPIYTDDELNWAREQVEAKGPMAPHMQRLFGDEEEPE